MASIIQIEAPGQEEPTIVTAASMGAVFLHGAAVTIHKAQGSQWPEVQVFAPDLYAAAQSGRQRGGGAALEAARLRRGDPGRGAAGLGDALRARRGRRRRSGSPTSPREPAPLALERGGLSAQRRARRKAAAASQPATSASATDSRP